jgi:hypothetical protein
MHPLLVFRKCRWRGQKLQRRTIEGGFRPLAPSVPSHTLDFLSQYLRWILTRHWCPHATNRLGQAVLQKKEQEKRQKCSPHFQPKHYLSVSLSSAMNEQLIECSEATYQSRSQLYSALLIVQNTQYLLQLCCQKFFHLFSFSFLCHEDLDSRRACPNADVLDGS